MPASATQLREYLAGFPEKTRGKGRAIFEQAWHGEDYEGADEYAIDLLDEGPRSARFVVPSQGGYEAYEVRLSWTKVKVTGRCDCPAFQDYGPCKHIVAAVCCLIEVLGDSPERNAHIEEAQIVSETPVLFEAPDLPEKLVIKENAGRIFRAIDWRIGNYPTPLSELRKITTTEYSEADCIWNFVYRQSAKQVYRQRIAYDRQETFRLSCSCPVFATVLCQHLFTAAAYLYGQKGNSYFLQFKDYSAEKASGLAKIGLRPDDPEAAEIRFHADAWGNLQMTVPEWLWPAANVSSRTQQMQARLGLRAPEAKAPVALQPAPGADFRPIAVLQTTTNNLPFPFELSIANGAGGKFTKLNTANQERLPELKGAVPKTVYNALLGISLPGLNTVLKAHGYARQLPNDVKYLSMESSETVLLMQRYTEALRTIWPWLSGAGMEVFTSAETRLTRAQSSAIRLYPAPVEATILVKPAGRFIDLILQYREAESHLLVEGRLRQVSGLLLRQDDTWYLPADDDTQRLMRQFPSGLAKIPAEAQEALLTGILPSLRSRYEVVLDETLQPAQIRPEPLGWLQLSEQGNKHLVLSPQFGYEGRKFYYEDDPEPVLIRSGQGWQEVIRDEAKERAFAESIRALHPLFEKATTLHAFFIPFGEALRDSWYQKMLAQMAELGIAVAGQESLQHFRYNPHQAKVSVSSPDEGGSGIDWFDLLIEITFGEQQVSLKEVRRALMNGQAGVRLDDGSIGLLPEDFVRDYGALLKLGSENKNGGLRVSKLHFTLIDSLHEAALGKDISEEIAAKKAALRDIESITTADVPEGINATLRPYQAAGYSWLQVLHRLGWGGCLADDMGLGKTLQVITFLQFLKNAEPGNRHLVVCPTSLIFNWQAELEKFAPELRYHIHYGLSRVWDPVALEGVDVVITSYGIMRTDLAALVEISWHYVILDESQAIKNPEAQTTKAAQALPARNRICMSGTPLQNNTYDLYAQFQFLNPGLLGSRELFRTEFANPIDKHGEEAPRTTLRKMLAPFMLRRTKEQVARDLPDKTEATLWYEMEKEQRAVYDEYRRYYRDSLLQRIDADGMAGSAIYVLEALLRLRQLCDHPALVKNKAVKTDESIKLEELRREIRENAGGRKVLVFSQFTEMLALIRRALEEDGISYAYLDGKTPAAKRREAVARFQEDASVQVFLISLKAGGVGLNLTAAEYVYLVDPWWNPAVEAQAIDRTHRIGQTNKIVAYRMICKDTVEEKVMLLQSRKRALAEGLVTEDAGFVKKLTREDVAFLLE